MASGVGLQSLLAAVRRRALGAGLLDALTGAVGLATMWTAFVVLAVGGGLSVSAAAPLYWLGLVVACGPTLYRLGWVPLSRWRQRGYAAALAEHRAREVGLGDPGGRLKVAQDLQQRLDHPRAADPEDPLTLRLAREAVRQGEAHARRLPPEQLIPMRPSPGSLGRLLGGTALLVMVVALNPAAGRRLLAALPWPSAAVAAESTAFLVGDIELTYVYPAYLRRDTLTVPGTNGDIHGPVGTQVTIRARTRGDYGQVALDVAFDSPRATGGLVGAPATADAEENALRIGMKRLERGLFEGTMLLQRAGRYAFRLDGTRESRERRIEVVPDAPPTVEILKPEAEVEVRETDVVEVEFKAEDDFAVSRIRLVYEAGGQEVIVPVMDIDPPTAKVARTFEWDLSTVPLVAGGRIPYRIEAADTSTLSVPAANSDDSPSAAAGTSEKGGQNDSSAAKADADASRWGRSATHWLKVFSLVEHHAALIARQEELVENMLRFLADILEGPVSAITGGHKTLADRVRSDIDRLDGLITTVDDLHRALADDALAPPIVVQTFAMMRDQYTLVRMDMNYVADVLGPARDTPPSTEPKREAAPWEQDDDELEGLVGIPGAVAPGKLRVGGRTFVPGPDGRMMEVGPDGKPLPQDRARIAELRLPLDTLRTLADNMHSRLTPLLENDIAQLVDLIRKQKYDLLVQEARELARLRRELTDLVRQYKTDPDPALKERIFRKIEELKKRIEELMRKLASTLQDIPEDFVNPDALKSEDMQNSLDDLMKKLEKGELDEALSDLERMEKEMNEMIERMEKGAEKLGENMFAETMKKLESLKQDLAQLEERQNAINRQVDDLRRKMAEKMESADARKRMEALAKRAEALAKRVRELGQGEAAAPFRYLWSMMERAADGADQTALALRLPDIAEALRSADLAASNLRSVADQVGGPRFPGMASPEGVPAAEARAVAQEMEAIAREIAKLMPDPAQALGEEGMRQLKRLGGQQAELERQAGGAQQDLRRMEEEMPMMPQGMSQSMSEARNHMRQGQGGMERGEPGRAGESGRQAGDRLRQMRESIEGMLKQMSESQGAQSGQPRSARPGQGQQPMSMPGQRPGQRDGDGRSPNAQPVRLPDAGQYAVPTEVRKDILEGMRGPAPAGFEQQNKAYKEALTQ